MILFNGEPVEFGSDPVSQSLLSGKTISFGPTGETYDFHAKWREFHCMRSPTMETLTRFIASLPSFGCSCAKNFTEILKVHEPRFHDWPRCSWELHNLVNVETQKPLFAWDDFKEMYPQWKQQDGYRIGVASVNYESLGGTETFHQTLVPRLSNVIGFASQNELRGDVSLLGVPTGRGVDAIASLALQSDTVISWNIDWDNLPRPNRLVTVHHGSIEDEWGTRFTLQGDVLVAVNSEVAEMLRTKTAKPVFHIPNAVDPERLKPRNAVDTFGKKICLWSHRFSPEKRPHLTVQIAEHLPTDWHMVMTGHRGQDISTNDRVTILPPTHPGDWLSVASCFLSTTIFEGFGLSIAEAITAGLPVVSTPTGIASRPGLAITLPVDAIPSQWAQAIATSDQHKRPDTDLFSLEDHVAAWSSILADPKFGSLNAAGSITERKVNRDFL